MKPGWTYVDLTILFVIYVPLAQLVLPASPNLPGGLLTGQWIVCGLWFLLATLRFAAWRRLSFWRCMALDFETRWAGIAVAVGLALAVGMAAASKWLPLPPVSSPLKPWLDNPSTRPLAALSVAGLGPLTEEIAFRGLAQPLFTHSFGPVAGTVLAAVPFALLHAPQLQYSWTNVALIAVAGLSFGWLRHRSGSTLTPVIAHAAYNGLLLLSYWKQGHHG